MSSRPRPRGPPCPSTAAAPAPSTTTLPARSGSGLVLPPPPPFVPVGTGGQRWLVSAVDFAGVRMEDVKNYIAIDQYYFLGTGCANQTSAVRVAGITYQDIRGMYSPQLHGGGGLIRFACSDSVACTGITMTDVELRPTGGDEVPLAHPYCWNAYGAMATLTVPPVYCLQEGRPESLHDQLDSCSVTELHKLMTESRGQTIEDTY